MSARTHKARGTFGRCGFTVKARAADFRRKTQWIMKKSRQSALRDRSGRKSAFALSGSMTTNAGLSGEQQGAVHRACERDRPRAFQRPVCLRRQRGLISAQERGHGRVVCRRGFFSQERRRNLFPHAIPLSWSRQKRRGGLLRHNPLV